MLKLNKGIKGTFEQMNGDILNSVDNMQKNSDNNLKEVFREFLHIFRNYTKNNNKNSMTTRLRVVYFCSVQLVSYGYIVTTTILSNTFKTDHITHTNLQLIKVKVIMILL